MALCFWNRFDDGQSTATRQRRHSFVSLIALTFAVTALTAGAAAAGCNDMTRLREALVQEGTKTANDSPGSAVVFGGCLLSGLSKYRETKSESTAMGTFSGCAMIGCAFTEGYGNCIGVNTSLFTLALRVATIEQAMRDQRCL